MEKREGAMGVVASRERERGVVAVEERKGAAATVMRGSQQ